MRRGFDLRGLLGLEAKRSQSHGRGREVTSSGRTTLSQGLRGHLSRREYRHCTQKGSRGNLSLKSAHLSLKSAHFSLKLTHLSLKLGHLILVLAYLNLKLVHSSLKLADLGLKSAHLSLILADLSLE